MAQTSGSGISGAGRLGHPQWFVDGNTSNIDTYRRGFSEVARIYPAVNDVPRVPTREAVEAFGDLWWLGALLVVVNTRHSGDLRFTYTDGSDAWPQPGANWQGPLLERPVKP